MGTTKFNFFDKIGDNNHLSDEDKALVNYLNEKAEREFREESKDREILKKQLKENTDEEMMVYVPDVYQEDIYSIDYKLLKEKGIKLVTFDIDDTIDDSIANKIEGGIPWTKVKMPAEAKNLFRYIKSLGLKVALLTNTFEGVAKDVYEYLEADGYIYHACKPEITNFVKMMEMFEVTPAEMAHVGNSMRDDIVGGNRAGVTTCLVRRAGVTLKIVKKIENIFGKKTMGQLIRQELLKRDLWRKHHKYFKEDQYYQLGETPKYRLNDH